MRRTTRTTETIQQRQYPRPGPPSLRTSSSSDSDSLHHRSRFPDNRSPRLSQSDPAKQQQQKKLGTRIANLESQLGEAQDELKCLKNQLASAESMKKKAQSHQIERKSKTQQQVLPVTVVIEMQEGSGKKQGIVDEHETLPETDVFEVVPIEKVSLEPESESTETAKQGGDLKHESVCLSKESQENDEISLLRTKIEEKDIELESFRQENENLKTQLNEKSGKITSAQSQVEELKSKLRQAEQELETCKSNTADTIKKFETTERTKQELENEMKTLRVQTEQWRKAADAAAYFLSGGMETSACGGGRRVSERCGSMDKVYYGSPFESVVGQHGYTGSMHSPVLIDDDDSDDVFGGGKKKIPSSGIRTFGDLWKKKGRK